MPGQESSPRCSIVILTRNRAHFLARTLQAILDHDGPTREILLFDNGSIDDTRAVATRFPVRYFSTPDLGLAAMRQRGLEEARGEFVIMCDDDCLPHEGWLKNFVRRFEEEPETALIGGRIINIGFDSKLEKGIGRFGRNGQIILGVAPSEATYFGCANLALRRKAILAWGGFDPFLISGYEEGDLATSLLTMGYGIGFARDAAVDHHNVSATQRTSWRWKHSGIMRIYFFLKHHRPRGFAWLSFLFWEGALQVKTLYRGPKTPLFTRLLGVVAAFCSLPYIVVRSGEARQRLLSAAQGSRPLTLRSPLHG